MAPENLVLPHDLNETYSRYAREFESSDELDSRPVALRTIALLAHGTGSLPLDVVLAAFSLEIQSDKATSRFQKDMEASPGVIVKDCKHMVDIDEELGVVRFVHHSVYEFFKTYKELERQTLIAELSLTYLGSPYFPTWSSRWSERAFLHELMHDNPFLVFASRNWADSVKKSPKKSYEHLMRLLAQVCCVGKHKAGDMAAKGTEEERIVLSFQVYLLAINEDPIPGVHQEHVLSYFRLINCLKDFHKKGALDLHKRDGDGLAAIHWVIRSTAEKNTRAGNTASQLGTGCTRSETCKMVATLIDCGAEVEAADAKGRTPLYYAAWFGKLDVVQLLLDMKAKVDAASEEFGTALQAASFRDHGSSYPHHAKVTEALLKAGASVNSLSKRGTPLHAIAWVGCVDCAERMFERRRFHSRPKKNVCEGDFGTAIHAAVFHGHYNMVDLLLKKGFDPNMIDEGLGSTLGAAVAGYGVDTEHTGAFVDICRLLITVGVKFIADRGEYETALNVAASLGHRDFVKLLLDNPTGPSAKEPIRTAYRSACVLGRETVKALFEERFRDIDSGEGIKHFPEESQHGLITDVYDTPARIWLTLFRITLGTHNIKSIEQRMKLAESGFRQFIEHDQLRAIERFARAGEYLFQISMSLAAEEDGASRAGACHRSTFPNLVVLWKVLLRSFRSSRPAHDAKEPRPVGQLSSDQTGDLRTVLDLFTQFAVRILESAFSKKNRTAVGILARPWTRALYLFTLQGEWGNNMLEALLKSRVAQVKQHLLNQSSDTGSGFEAAEKLTDVGMELLITALGQGQTHRPLASVIVKVWVDFLEDVEQLGERYHGGIQKLV
ncbi:hypothetical protein SLS55_005027 [Diplodia seriata]|uniref:Ankyrin repeat protein n=1 Tax=Diplodia seriata TaxID=420778 RepID=A0ABR3CGA3_9PEZI